MSFQACLYVELDNMIVGDDLEKVTKFMDSMENYVLARDYPALAAKKIANKLLQKSF